MRISDRRRHHLAAFIALVTLVVYLASLRNGFIPEWDDGDYVLNNPYIRSFNLAFLKWAFCNFYASNWHPLTWISHAADYAIWGVNPLGHHLTSIILHTVNTFVVVMLIMRLQQAAIGARPNGQESLAQDRHGMLITAGVTGLLFGLHPLHVESVAWVAERKDLLCALFFLLSIERYMRYVASADDRPTGHALLGRFVTNNYLLSLGFFILALMSKPMAVSLPAVLLILDWYPFRRLRSVKTARVMLVEKLPFIACSIISAVLTILAQRAWGSVVELQTLPLSSRLAVAAQSLLVYLWKMAVPRNLIPYYPYPKDISPLSVGFLLAFAGVIVISIFCAIIAKRQKLGLALWGYYVVTLLPVIGIVQVGSQSMADRYTYLPSLAPFLLVGAVAAWGYGKAVRLNRARSIGKNLFFGAGILMFVGLSFLSVRQIHIWESGISLWSYVIEKEPEKDSIAYTNLGSAYQKKGQLDKAIENYDKAISLNPKDYLAYNNRGAILAKVGQFDEAIESYNKAILSNPGDYKAYFNRGLTYDKMGRIYDSIQDFQRALGLNMRDPRAIAWAYNNLGILYGKEGMDDKSVAAFNNSIAIEPNYPVTYYNRGIAYAFMGRYKEAIEDFSKVILLDRHYASAYYNRGDAYVKTGATVYALADFSTGCSLGDSDSCNALQEVRMEMTPGQKR
jgi:tetratricopeptide (TPR) repeat protein